MSELEMALQQEGLLDLVAQRCRETGLSITEVLRDTLRVRTVTERTTHRVSEERNKVAAETWEKMMARATADPDWFRTELGRVSREYPLDFTSEEAYELSHD